MRFEELSVGDNFMYHDRRYTKISFTHELFRLGYYGTNPYVALSDNWTIIPFSSETLVDHRLD